MSPKHRLATSSWGDSEITAMNEVIAEGNFTMGKRVKLFEKKFSEFIEAKYCVMVNSGSSANLLMIAALFYSKQSNLKLKRGDEIIVPAVSWSTTYFPLYQYGLKIKFVDIDLETLNYDLSKLENAISKKTRAIMAVNLLGNSNDFESILSLISGKDIVLVEDNCESMGAEFSNKKTGTFGVMGTFSTFFSHHISTMEGGIVATDDDELYHILLSLRAHGWTRDLPTNNLVCSQKNTESLKEDFRFVLPGYNVRPLELQGAIGIEQIKKLPMIISGRQKNAILFKKLLKNHPDLMTQKEVGKSSWFGFSLIIKPKSKLDRASLAKILSSLRFEYRPIVTGNFAKNEVTKYFDSEIHGELKNADYIDKNGVFIGNHHYPMSDALLALREI